MATSLDRAVWLVLERSDLWEALGHEAHALLTDQPAPHGAFFSWLDRTVHAHGALNASALAAELDGAAVAPGLSQLLARVRGFLHVPPGEAARAELGVIVDRLRLSATQGELETLAGAGGLSEANKARQRTLLDRQRQLKERLARSAIAP